MEESWWTWTRPHVEPAGALPPFDGPAAWRGLVGGSAVARPRAFPLVETRDLVRAGLDALAWLRRRRDEGRVITIARGRHIAVPPGAASDWAPDRVEAGWLVAVSVFGWSSVYLSGATAAALHGAARHPAGEVHVTGQRQRRDIRLPGVATTLRLHQRAERDHSGEHGDPAVLTTIRGELCSMLITTVPQTRLDLEHSWIRTGHPYAAWAAADAIARLPGGDEIRTISKVQRRLAAYGRLTGWRSREPPPPRA